jgi:hypothetical protein
VRKKTFEVFLRKGAENTLLGIGANISLLATLLTRTATLWFKLIVSYVAFQAAGTEILRQKPKANLNPSMASWFGWSLEG